VRTHLKTGGRSDARRRDARAARTPTRDARAVAAAIMAADAPTKAFKIYTKTGDAGTSALYNRERRDKDDATFDALGDVDECNVACGIAREHCVEENNGLEAQVRARARDARRRRRRETRARATTDGEGDARATRSSRRSRVDCSTSDRRWRRRSSEVRTR